MGIKKDGDNRYSQKWTSKMWEKVAKIQKKEIKVISYLICL